jgi:NAD(P)-dependent dehydrogenase (short-subunit alcohol dehydrogenase family)
MPEPVDPRHLLLIGAGPGVGAGVVRRFGREGFRSTLISRGGGTLDQLARELRSGDLGLARIDAGGADGHEHLVRTGLGRATSRTSRTSTPP